MDAETKDRIDTLGAWASKKIEKAQCRTNTEAEDADRLADAKWLCWWAVARDKAATEAEARLGRIALHWGEHKGVLPD